MVDPFAEINFLTRSENRVELLETLAAGQHTERDLVEATGISDVTVGRILDDFEERGWIEERGGAYTTTVFGDVLAADYARLADSMDMTCRLGPFIELLPTEEMDFDVRLLTDARISDPETFNTMRAIDRWIELIRQSDEIRGTTVGGGQTVARAAYEELAADRLRLDLGVTPTHLERVRRSAELSDIWKGMVREGAEVYRLAEDVSFSISTNDDIAAIAGFDETGALRVGVETRADAVHEWVRETYESYRAEATLLEPGDF